MPSAWFKAAYDGDIVTLKDLLAQGVDVNSWEVIATHKGVTALHHAALNVHLECVRLLIAAGADVNADYDKTPGWRGWTPLICAVEGQDQEENLEAVEIVRLLLESGADSNVRYISTALEMAEQNSLESTEILLRQAGSRE